MVQLWRKRNRTGGEEMGREGKGKEGRGSRASVVSFKGTLSVTSFLQLGSISQRFQCLLMVTLVGQQAFSIQIFRGHS